MVTLPHPGLQSVPHQGRAMEPRSPWEVAPSRPSALSPSDPGILGNTWAQLKALLRRRPHRTWGHVGQADTLLTPPQACTHQVQLLSPRGVTQGKPQIPAGVQN